MRNDDDINSLYIVLAFFITILIIVVSRTIWMAIGLNILLLFFINKIFSVHAIQEGAIGSLILPLLFLLYVVCESYRNKEKYNNNFIKACSSIYRELRYATISLVEKCTRRIGFSSEIDLPVIERVVCDNNKISFFDYVYKLKVPIKKELLPDNCESRSFWYMEKTQLKDSIITAKNPLILMTCIPRDYGDKVYNHQYCLICPRDTDEFTSASLVKTSEIPDSCTYVVAVSLGPIELANTSR